MSELKVVHLLGALFPSGMERMLASAADAFKNEGIRSIIVGQGTHHPFRSTLAEAGYEVHVIPSVRSFKGCLALAELLVRQRPQIIHIHTESAFLLAVITSTIASRAAVVRTVHSVFRPSGRAALSRRIQARLADRFVARFVAPSPDVAVNEAKWGREADIIFNWVSSSYIETANSNGENFRDPMLAVLVGNCADVKNHEMVLRHLVISGYDVAHHGNEARASTEELRLLDELSKAGRLKYRGTGAPLESLRSGGVFVLPSLHEGMSVALAEAIAAGTPCLVADSTGLSWAKGINGVQHIALTSEDKWAAALPKSGYRPVSGTGSAPDLSPARGASEYARIYRSASKHPRVAYEVGLDSGK